MYLLIWCVPPKFRVFLCLNMKLLNNSLYKMKSEFLLTNVPSYLMCASQNFEFSKIWTVQLENCTACGCGKGWLRFPFMWFAYESEGRLPRSFPFLGPSCFNIKIKITTPDIPKTSFGPCLLVLSFASSRPQGCTFASASVRLMLPNPPHTSHLDYGGPGSWSSHYDHILDYAGDSYSPSHYVNGEPGSYQVCTSKKISFWFSHHLRPCT